MPPSTDTALPDRLAALHPVAQVLQKLRSGFWAVGSFSFLINVLMLTGPLFMLQIYDRVLASQSVPTLVLLGLLVLFLYLVLGGLELIRARLMTRMAHLFDISLADLTFANSLRREANGKSAQKPVRFFELTVDLERIRRFLSGPGATLPFDAPWFPLYLLVIFILHPVLALVAALGAGTLVLVAVANEIWSAKPAQKTRDTEALQSGLIRNLSRNDEAVHAMGMSAALGKIWQAGHLRFLLSAEKNADISALFVSTGKTLRLFLQSLMLAVGAYLVILQEMSAGAMIAGSIILARALAPVEQAITQWRNIMSCRESFARLKQMPAHDDTKPTTLPAPRKRLEVNGLTVFDQSGTTKLVTDISFAAKAGESIGVIGPSGSGKTSLFRALAGGWTGYDGDIRLDGASLNQWSPSALGRHIGYLPQRSELFDGTFAQNINRFDQTEKSKAVINAAKSAHAHDLIVGFPDGYDTHIGSKGVHLSAGEQQRIGLARAVYNRPFLVVLDEPNANLDAAGEIALLHAIERLKKNGSIVVLSAHRRSALSQIDKLLVLERGACVMFGPRDKVLSELGKLQTKRAQGALKVV